MRRLSLAVLFAITMLAFVPSAFASGIPLKGSAVDSAQASKAVTGGCVCDTIWYTVDLKPGVAHVTAVLMGYQGAMSPTYAIRVRLFQGKRFLSFAQASCLRSQHRCSHTARLSVRVHHRAVYYVSVDGPGATVVNYSMRVQGNIVPLRCRTGCVPK